MKSRLSAFTIVAILGTATAAQATTQGWVKGKLRFYQNQGNYCPTSRNCTGANYVQSQYHTFQPIPSTVVVILSPGGSQIGGGITDINGNFLIPWSSSGNATAGKLQWYAENSDGHFNVRTGTGARQVFTSAQKSLPNGTTMGSPTNWGNLDWGSSSAPHPVANVYEGAFRTMNYSIAYTSSAWSNFWGIEIRAFDASCPTSCASGTTVVLDTGSTTPYAYSARVAHELGHIVSGLTSQGLNQNSCNDYSRNGGGWAWQGGEWMCATLEEAYATFIGDVGRYWYGAVDADTCANEAGVCSMMLEPSSAISPGGCNWGAEEDRWPLTTERVLWDGYDVANDGGWESAAEPFWAIAETMNAFAIGNANGDRDEPYCSGSSGSLCDQDGKGEWDFLVNYVGSGSIIPGDSINCTPPGD